MCSNPSVYPLAPEQDRQPSAAGTGADRVLATLTRLARHPRGVTLQELARELDLPKSTVHRTLAALQRAGFAERSGRGRYRLGLEFVRLAFEFHEERDEARAVEPALEALAARFSETAHYAALDGGEVVYLAKVVPRGQSVRMTSTVGGRNPAHCTGVGKALLASALEDAGEVERFVAEHGPLAARTPQTIVDAAELAAELERTRRRRYALDREESEPGVVCFAVPVFLESRTHPSGAISVSALAHRTPLGTLEAAADEIRGIIDSTIGSVTR
jgi:DNA-binding IclR family transcriptional regulator